MFNEVFLTDVFVPDDAVVGAVGGGWAAARTTLANERVSMGSRLVVRPRRRARPRRSWADLGAADPVDVDHVGGLLADGPGPRRPRRSA